MLSTKRQPAKIHPTNSSAPVVDLVYRDASDKIAHKYVFWRHEPTADALEDWMIDYLDQVSDGYIPEGFTVAPKPFCARIYKRGNVLAEWIKPVPTPYRTELISPAPSAESPVTAKKRAGRGGIHAVVPSTTTSGASFFRPTSATTGDITPSGSRYPDPTAVNDAGEDVRFRSGSGQPAA